MQKFQLAALFLFLSLLAAAQPKAEWYDHPGSITMPDGTVRNGIIRNYGSDQAPWHFQPEIKFMDSTKWVTLTKVKNKDFEEFKPKDLKGFQVHDLQLSYMPKPYSDMTAVSLKMKKTWYFMKVILQGKVNLYYYYDSPEGFFVGSEEEHQQLKKDAATNNYVLLERETDKLKNVGDVDVREWVADCPEVIKKYEAGEYGVNPFGDKEKKKGLMKLAAKVYDADLIRAYAEKIFADYNECGK